MQLKEIHQHLKAKFGDGIGEWFQPEAGDAWIEVSAAAWPQVAAALKNDPALAFDYLRCVTGTDYPPDEIQVVFHFLAYTHDHEAIIKIKLPREKPNVASVMELWPAADWHERETYDLLGIVFEGHAALRRILLPDDWRGFPLRKDYKQPDEYHGISNW